MSVCRSAIPAVILLEWLVFNPHLRPAWAQQGAPSPAAGAAALRPIASAVQVTDPPVVDGVLDDRAWQDATPLMGFVQAEPFEGQPASENTEVRILYDDQAIYVGVVCHDSDPSQIVTTDTRRDAGLGDMDSFQIIFDTFRDQQNGFVFGTNAAGIQYDAQVRSQGNPTSSWDGSWEVQTSDTGTGWAAEFRIPLRTLRYGPPPQTWGVNFFRNIQRSRERTYLGAAGADLQRGTFVVGRRAARAQSRKPTQFQDSPLRPTTFP